MKVESPKTESGRNRKYEKANYTKIESVILKLPKNENPGSDSSTGKFYKTFAEDLTLILLNPFQKTAEERTLSNLLPEATITLIPNLEKDIIKKENYRPILL